MSASTIRKQARLQEALPCVSGQAVPDTSKRTLFSASGAVVPGRVDAGRTDPAVPVPDTTPPATRPGTTGIPGGDRPAAVPGAPTIPTDLEVTDLSDG